MGWFYPSDLEIKHEADAVVKRARQQFKQLDKEQLEEELLKAQLAYYKANTPLPMVEPTYPKEIK